MTKEERREYMKQYRKEHKDQINKNARRRYLRKWETIRAQQKAYYQRKKARLEQEIVGKYGCRWSDGTGNAPDGTYCGECDPSYESKCTHLVHDSAEWVECKNCANFEDCDTKENRDGCYCGEEQDDNENIRR